MVVSWLRSGSLSVSGLTRDPADAGCCLANDASAAHRWLLLRHSPVGRCDGSCLLTQARSSTFRLPDERVPPLHVNEEKGQHE